MLQSGSVDTGADGNANAYIDSYLESVRSMYSGTPGVVQNSFSSAYYTFKDSDNDGLLDVYEFNNTYTDPNRRDTDGDGKDDKTEIESGTDPKVAPHPGGEIVYPVSEYTVKTARHRKVQLY